MAHKVQVNEGRRMVVLPDGEVYNGRAVGSGDPQTEVVLTDVQYAQISPTMFTSNILDDLGAVPDPAIDAVFATDTDLAAEVDEQIGDDLRVELGYGSTSSLLAVSATTFTDLPGVTCTFTPGDKINWLDFGAYIQLSTPGSSASVILSFQVLNVADSAVVATWNHRCWIAAATGVDLRWHTKRQRLGLLTASVQKTYKVQAKIGTSGHSATLWGGAGTETYLAVEER